MEQKWTDELAPVLSATTEIEMSSAIENICKKVNKQYVRYVWCCTYYKQIKDEAVWKSIESI